MHRLRARGLAAAPVRDCGNYGFTADTSVPAWPCRESNEYELSDVRSTASRGRVIHWQAGS